MGKPNKTDRLDARGLGILLRNGTLPECWIPPGELRDQRELLRTRMALRDMRIKLKLRIHAALDRYGLQAEGISDLFGKSGRVYLAEAAAELPSETRRMVVTQLGAIDELTEKIDAVEKRIQEQIAPSAEVKLLLTISDRCQASLRHGVVDARNAHHQPHLFVLPSFAHQPLLQFCDFQLGLFQQTQIAVTRLRFFFRQRQLSQPNYASLAEQIEFR
jgi:transposase